MKRLPLDSVADVFNGKTPAKSDQRTAGHPVLKIRDIDETGTFRGQFESFVDPDFAQQFAGKRVRAGDTLILNAAHNADYVGSKICLVRHDTAGALATGEWLVVRPTDADPLFVHYWLRSSETARSLRDLVKGIHLYPKDVARLFVPDPGRVEQRRIAEVLDKADAIRRKRKEAIALTDELLRSTFLELFGDPVRNPKGWRTVTIGELCERGASLVDGPFGSSLKPEHYTPDGVRVVRNWNIRDDDFDDSQFKYVTPAKFEELRRSEVWPGDILLTTKGTVGDVCLMPTLPGPSVLSASGTVRLRLPPTNELLGPVVVSQMVLPSYKRYLHSFEAGSAQQYLNLTGIRKMRLMVPPGATQKKFALLREAIGKMKERATAGVTGAEKLFSSLVARAFRGELKNDWGRGSTSRAAC